MTLKNKLRKDENNWMKRSSKIKMSGGKFLENRFVMIIKSKVHPCLC